MRIVIRGITEVVENHLEEESEVREEAVLRKIASQSHLIEEAYTPEEAFTEFINDGSSQAAKILKALKPGGWIRFEYNESSNRIEVVTEYVSDRDLTDLEIQYLVNETVGQWSDGIGMSLSDDFSEHIFPFYVELCPFVDDDPGPIVQLLP